MKTTDFYNTPDSTYFNASTVAPEIHDQDIRLTSGQGKRRSWGAPQCNNTVLIDEHDFCAILTGFSHKHGGGQFYRYFVQTETGVIERRTWPQLTDDERALVLAAYQEKAPSWARSPGKLSTERTPAKREGGDHYYKAVELRDDGRMFSLFDGKTEYVLGQTLQETAHQGHQGGIYVYRTPGEAQDFAEQYHPSRAIRILYCRCEGNYCVYSSGKLAFSRVTPTGVFSR